MQKLGRLQIVQQRPCFGQRFVKGPQRDGCLAKRARRLCLSCRASKSSASNLITQEVMLFVFQQDLEATLVRALNTDKQDVAQDIRDRLQQIDTIVQEVQAIKGASTSDQADSKPVDIAESFRLRSNLQEAIMAERYEEAARLRDELRILQEKLDAVSGKADEASQRLKLQRRLRLGQRVKHKDTGFRGIVCGWDASCSESEGWQSQAGIGDLEHGQEQPFYQLLVDIRDSERVGQRGALIAYVPQEELQYPAPHEDWVEEYGGDGFANPILYRLFLGRDERGDFLPARALREKYSQERRDVYPSDDEDEDEDDSSDQTTEVSSDADMLNKLFKRSDDSGADDEPPKS